MSHATRAARRPARRTAPPNHRTNKKGPAFAEPVCGTWFNLRMRAARCIGGNCITRAPALSSRQPSPRVDADECRDARSDPLFLFRRDLGRFDAIGHRGRLLAEELDPLLLERGVVLGRLDQVEEAVDRALEPLSGAARWPGARPARTPRAPARARTCPGNTRAPRCSSGMRSDQSPRLPPTIDGDAESRKRLLAVEGLRAGARRPVDQVLEHARHRRVVLGRRDDERVGFQQPLAQEACARGIPSSNSKSPSYDGHAKWLISA